MKQCSWCQAIDGQSYWKVVDGVLGGKDGKARGISRLKDFRARIVTEGGNACEVDVFFCTKAEARAWEHSLGKRFLRWLGERV